jgi:Zn-dependent protease with chaperone function
VNFFESQDIARRNTGKLIFLFAMAVISLILITNLLVMVVFGVLSAEVNSVAAANGVQFDWEIFAWIGLLVSAVILLGSLYKIATLSGGGARVAEMMNGHLVVAGSGDFKQQQLLNVVEEMAIASGTPVPPVYLMHEDGINAFAAGYSPSDAVIGITQGALETLSREQLQGVIAHEFSHILHGDMRINIRLIGILHGIMVLGIIGYYLLRGGAHSRRSKDSGGIVFLGLGLMVIGFVGTFFGNLIKAAVSRQREYLADASAVQYTRNPEGIAGALMQIGNHSSRSYLNHPGSSEISHALFEEGSKSAFSRLYATHPPLNNRIEAILPYWDGSYDLISRQSDQQVESSQPESSQRAGSMSRKEKLTAAIVSGAILGEEIVSQAGNLDPQNLQQAQSLLQDIPEVLLDAAREPSSARALVYLLVLSGIQDTRAEQLQFLKDSADQGVYQALADLLASTQQVMPEFRLPLIEICLSSLRQLSDRQYKLFKDNFEALIKLDNKVNLFEWSLQQLLFHHLRAVFDRSYKPRLGRKDLQRCSSSVSILLSVLVYGTQQEGIDAETAFKAGAELLPMTVKQLEKSSIEFSALNLALEELKDVKPLQKPILLKAMTASVEADGVVRPEEIELVRAVAASIDCPVPPLTASS